MKSVYKIGGMPWTIFLSVLVKAETSGIERGTRGRVINIPSAPWARKGVNKV